MDEHAKHGWIRFMLRSHLWNQHRVANEFTRGLSLEELGDLHLWYNCPPGEARRYLGCHLRTRPRRTRRRRVSQTT